MILLARRSFYYLLLARGIKRRTILIKSAYIYESTWDSCHLPHDVNLLRRRFASWQRLAFLCQDANRRRSVRGPDGCVPAYLPGLTLDFFSLLPRQSLRPRPARRVESLLL